MDMNTRKSKQEFQRQFLERAGINFPAVKALMDFLPNVGFYIKDANDRIVTLNQRNCEISALKDEFDAIDERLVARQQLAVRVVRSLSRSRVRIKQLDISNHVSKNERSEQSSRASHDLLLTDGRGKILDDPLH